MLTLQELRFVENTGLRHIIKVLEARPNGAFMCSIVSPLCFSV